MPFPFTEICTLLERLEKNEFRNGLLARERDAEARKIIEGWFKSHQRHIRELDINGATALLSTLLPEWRTDRVFGAQTAKLNAIIKRAIGLRNSSIAILDAYKNPGAGDLATCLERVMEDLGPPAEPTNVTVEEVDELLQEWAGLSSFSDPSVPRLPRKSSSMRDEAFGYILKRLEHKNAKWIVRLILKDFSPVKIDEDVVLRSFHFLLPDLLRFQRNFHSAVTTLKTQLREYPEHPDAQSERLHRRHVDQRVGLRPVIGTKVGRPNFNKAWSIDHCIKLLGANKWVVERKYDGEFCEIHVDLDKSPDVRECIKIFSKSGKDSTHDRQGIIDTLVECLQLGSKDCKFKRHAILLGELVVWSDGENHVMDFSEIRKHVTRSGRSLGADLDSQAKADEHLAIVFFDLLLLDDEIVMNRPVEERRLWLREAYKKMHGRALSAEWKQIDFAQTSSTRRLVQQFAASDVQRCEGLVLKPCGFPYFSIESPNRSFIKVKKDYIKGMGDECDFAVIGASYDSQLAMTTKLSNIRWTSFHLGCLTNKEDVRRYQARPVFKYVGTIECEHCIPKAELEAANSVARFASQPYNPEVGMGGFDVQKTALLKMDHAFFPPLVFEVLGSGFQKPSNCTFWMLRHPRVKKMHQDRAWEDCVGFEELQQQAAHARILPSDLDSDETLREIERIERTFRRKLDSEGTLTPRSRRTTTPESSAPDILQQSTPTRPLKPHVTALPTPLQPSSAPQLPSFPIFNAANYHRPRLAVKRKSDESPNASIAKKPRSSASHRRLPTPPTSSPPLIEISNNADIMSAQLSARTCRQSYSRPAATTKFTSLFNSKPQTTSPAEPDSSTAATCASSPCPFSNAVVYAAPCIANTPWVMENLLQTHHTSTVADPSHWDRDSFAHEPLADTVSESQSYPRMRKIVLVEAGRHAAVRDVMARITALNEGRFRERVDVYDWRVLEECRDHDRGPELVKKHFLGATLFDEARQRAFFVSDRAWLEVCDSE